MANQNNSTKRNFPSIWLFIALLLTVTYIVILWMAADVTVDIAGENRPCNSGGRLAGWFGCLTMNELGDFLAGAFAPLAFIWLAAAVFIQSQELKAQRTELTLTRDEFKLNRKVMEAQANYIGEQTEILRREQKSREDAERVRVFEAAIERIAGRLRDNIDCLSLYSKVGNEKSNFDVHVYNIIRGNNTDKELIRKISNYYKSIEFSIIKSGFEKANFYASSPQSFQDVYVACQNAFMLIEDLPEEAKITAEEIGLEPFISALTWISGKLINEQTE